MTNTQKNKLIEAFMGWELKYVTEYDLNQWCFINKNTGKTISGLKKNSELPYCTDWNWLMEALFAFDNILILYESLDDPAEYEKFCDVIDYAVTLYNIDDASNALCEGIEWYNNTVN